LGGFAAQLGAIVLDAKKEVLDAEQLRRKLVRYWNLTPAEAG
jgi:hypothetical protein